MNTYHFINTVTKETTTVNAPTWVVAMGVIMTKKDHYNYKHIDTTWTESE